MNDVVALIHALSSSDMKIVERIRYDAYGRPSSFSPGDVCKSGGGSGLDAVLDGWDGLFAGMGTVSWNNDFATGTSGTNYLPDGTQNSHDATGHLDISTNPNQEYGGGGFGVLSSSYLENRVGYAGYRFDPVLNRSGASNGKPVWHVRARVLDSTSGKWLQMDPARYVDGPSLYQYIRSKPSQRSDPLGLCASCGSRAGIVDPGDVSPGPVVPPYDPSTLPLTNPASLPDPTDIPNGPYYDPAWNPLQDDPISPICTDPGYFPDGIFDPFPYWRYINPLATDICWATPPAQIDHDPYDEFPWYVYHGRFYYWWYNTVPWQDNDTLANMSELEMVSVCVEDAMWIYSLGTYGAGAAAGRVTCVQLGRLQGSWCYRLPGGGWRQALPARGFGDTAKRCWRWTFHNVPEGYNVVPTGVRIPIPW